MRIAPRLCRPATSQRRGRRPGLRMRAGGSATTIRGRRLSVVTRGGSMVDQAQGPAGDRHGRSLGARLCLSHADPAWSFWVYCTATFAGCCRLLVAPYGHTDRNPLQHRYADVDRRDRGSRHQRGGRSRYRRVPVRPARTRGGRRRQSGAGVEALVNLVPRTALRLSGTQTEVVPVEALGVGDIAMVRLDIRSDWAIRCRGRIGGERGPVMGDSAPVAKTCLIRAS
jgi:Zn2+/Cd2+-exporting ATPase